MLRRCSGPRARLRYLVRRTCIASVLAVLALSSGRSLAHEAISTELTWTRDVSRVFFNRCSGCHRAGGDAPMPLTTYAEVRPWAKAIKHQVLTRRMPPWGAVKGFGTFRNDRSLSLPEIALISSWVEGGAPEGDPTFGEPFHFHGDDAAQATPQTSRLKVRGVLALDQPLLATGVSVSADGMAPWLQVTAHRPDGSVEHLLWLREPRLLRRMDYWFLRHVALPAGTRLVCQPETAEVDLRFVGEPGDTGR